MLKRRITLLQAVSLNMGMMVGVGPFITIPIFVGALGGPQAMVGWLLGALVAMADGLVWSELAAAYPGSGGTYHFYDAIYGPRWIGRLLKFLFVWQFLISVPLELASGGIGLSRYAGFFSPSLKSVVISTSIPWFGGSSWTWTVTLGQFLAVLIIAVIVGLAYRRIEAAAQLMVLLWAGVLLTVAWMILAGLSRFDPGLAFAFPNDAWSPTRRNALGLGVATGIAMYDLFGYYQVCYLGDEVVAPSRTIPRSILIAVLAVSGIYLTMNLGILGVVPTAEVIASQHIASDFMLRRYGPWAANAITGLILWTGTASLYAGLLGYSRVPYAAARAGHFYAALGAVHPTGDFPHRSLLLVGGLTAAACLFDLEAVIGGLIASRLWIQFVGQIATVIYLRVRPGGSGPLPFRMPLFPLPALVSLAGWLFVFCTLRPPLVIVIGLLTLGVGTTAFVLWDASVRRAIRSGSGPSAPPPESRSQSGGSTPSAPG